MKNSKSPITYRATGGVFLLLAVIFFASGNTAMGIAFLAIGVVFVATSAKPPSSR